MDDLTNRKILMDNYKMTLCRMWEKKGECKFGSECTYAHGKEDQYRKRLCPKYISDEGCDEKCHKLHFNAIDVEDMFRLIQTLRTDHLKMMEENNDLLHEIADLRTDHLQMMEENNNLLHEITDYIDARNQLIDVIDNNEQEIISIKKTHDEAKKTERTFLLQEQSKLFTENFHLKNKLDYANKLNQHLIQKELENNQKIQQLLHEIQTLKSTTMQTNNSNQTNSCTTTIGSSATGNSASSTSTRKRPYPPVPLFYDDNS